MIQDTTVYQHQHNDFHYHQQANSIIIDILQLNTNTSNS